MSGGRSRNDSVARCHFENVFDTRHVQVTGVRSEAITGDPKIDVRRLNFRDLGKLAGRPVFFYSVDDELFSLDGFWLLMLNRGGVAVSELRECELALREIYLLAFLL